MHPNPAFRKTPQEQALDFARERGFGILTINGPDGPLSAHVPFTISADATKVRAHLVASNPLYRALSDGTCKALISISGPDSYISPDWYGIQDQVPTWNYVAVNIRGGLSAASPEKLREILDELSAHFETRLAPKPAWTADKTNPETLAKMMRQIRPVEMQIANVESTFKLGQNKPIAARRGAANQLADAGIGQEVATLAQMMSSPD